MVECGECGKDFSSEVMLKAHYNTEHLKRGVGKPAAAPKKTKNPAPSGGPLVRCPTCTGTDVERVSIGTRAASGVLGGLIFARKARKQFHCRNCNYYW